MTKARRIAIILGFFSVLWGLTYTLGLYGPTEREVAGWGVLEVMVGLFIIGLSFFIARGKHIKALLIVLLSINTLLQILPSILWFLFNGTGISDGSPPSDFVASWIYSLPHISIGLLGVLCITLFIRKPNLHVKEN